MPDLSASSGGNFSIEIPILTGKCIRTVEVIEAHNAYVLYSYMASEFWRHIRGQLLDTIDRAVTDIEERLRADPQPELLGVLLLLLEHQSACQECEDANRARDEEGLGFQCGIAAKHMYQPPYPEALPGADSPHRATEPLPSDLVASTLARTVAVGLLGLASPLSNALRHTPEPSLVTRGP